MKWLRTLEKLTKKKKQTKLKVKQKEKKCLQWTERYKKTGIAF